MARQGGMEGAGLAASELAAQLTAEPASFGFFQAVRLLERLGALTNALEADELALEGGVVRRPDRLHRKQRLAQEPEPSADGDPVMRELSLDPAGRHS